jgi:hypothetical protein
LHDVVSSISERVAETCKLSTLAREAGHVATFQIIHITQTPLVNYIFNLWLLGIRELNNYIDLDTYNSIESSFAMHTRPQHSYLVNINRAH